jgi:hypothetical protein
MNFLENITFRRNRTKSDSIVTESNSLEEIIDNSANSLPEISQDGDTVHQLEAFKEQIDKLTNELNSAHNEIESLSIENNKLKRINEDLVKKTELYKKVTLSPISTTPNLKRQKRKNITNNSQPNKSRTDIDKHNKQNTPATDRTHSYQTQNQLPKISIISTNKNNKILSIAEKTFSDYRLCHYLTSNCKLKQLIHSLESKLTNYTLKDFCVILIGEDDFKTTNDYSDIIICLRETLLKTLHTNVILCLPTFKQGRYTTVFNSRVEIFNNMLYLDVATHEYVYLIDSNKNLSYDSEMYNYNTRSINNHGMRTIFEDILTLINNIKEYQCVENSEGLENNLFLE